MHRRFINLAPVFLLWLAIGKQNAHGLDVGIYQTDMDNMPTKIEQDNVYNNYDSDPSADMLTYLVPVIDKTSSGFKKRNVNLDNIPVMHMLHGGFLLANQRSRRDKLSKVLTRSLFVARDSASQKRSRDASYVPILHKPPSQHYSRSVSRIFAGDSENHVPLLHKLYGKRSSPDENGILDFQNGGGYLDENGIKKYWFRSNKQMPVKKSPRGSLLHLVTGKGYAGSVIAPKSYEEREGPKGYVSFSSFNGDMGR
jgi:hypothetical protein